MIRTDVTDSTRLAGLVMRYHTHPTLHPQSVGEHTWQVMRLYWELYGDLPPEVSSYILWHDASELYTGDIPFPVKARNPKLKSLMDDMEDHQLARMIGVDRQQEVLGGVTELQRVRMKLCDLLDMHEHGHHEMMLGNQFAIPIVEDTAGAIVALVLQVPDTERDMVLRRVRLKK